MTDTPPIPIPAAIPAATLVIFRERLGGPPEFLMVERAKAMVFAGGALVFPGGRVDPGDRALAATLGIGGDDGAARIAAIRETIEEAGLPIGLAPAPTPTALLALRAALHAGEDFGAALARSGSALDPGALVYFARWLPRHEHLRIFDTRFYLARLIDDALVASVDATENVRLIWTTAQGLLDDADAGRAAIIFPTRRNLERLARFASFDAAVADTHAHPVETVTPWIEDRAGVPHLCIPDHLGYPIAAEALATTKRG